MKSTLIAELLDTLDKLVGGVHAGFRPAHAKGVMCSGTFTPSPRRIILGL
jgi:catalase